MLIEQTMYICAKRNFTDKFDYTLFSGAMADYGYIDLGTIDVEFEVPDVADMTEREIEVLELAKLKVRGECERQINYFNDAISKLRCLTYIPAEAEVV